MPLCWIFENILSELSNREFFNIIFARTINVSNKRFSLYIFMWQSMHLMWFFTNIVLRKFKAYYAKPKKNQEPSRLTICICYKYFQRNSNLNSGFFKNIFVQGPSMSLIWIGSDNDFSNIFPWALGL